MRRYFTLFILLISCLSSFSQTDAAVDGVYTLGKIPRPLGTYNHVVQARVSNQGSAAFADLPVTLNIDGANSFTNTQLVTLGAGEFTVVSFETSSYWNSGTNSVTVSVPTDANNANNSAVYLQMINADTFSFADNSPVVSSLGFGTGDGILLVKYQTSGSGRVREIRAHISNSASNIGQTVYAVVATYGALLGQSAPHVITADDLGQYVSFGFAEPVEVTADNVLLAGLAQVADGSTEYYPLSYQQETVPTRPDSYFASLSDGSGLTELNFVGGRLMIQAIVDIGTISPYNSSSSSTGNSVIAGWDFSSVNSPLTFAATTFDTSLNSSNLMTRGPDAVRSNGEHMFRTKGFSNNGISTSNTDYFQVTLSPKPGKVLSLNLLSAFVHTNDAEINVSGVNSQFAYSLNGSNFTLIDVPFTINETTGQINVSLTEIAALQNVSPGTTVTFRYYASGNAAISDWGFISMRPGSNGLAVSGRVNTLTTNTVFTAPVVPNGADFTLAGCAATANGSVNFTSTGTFAAGNKYIVQLGQLFTTNGVTYSFRNPVNIGSETSSANSGTINFTVPAGTNAGNLYALRVLSTSPYVSGSWSQGFNIKGSSCKSLATDNYRTKASGDWSSPSIWESYTNNTWIPATLIPNDLASRIEISVNDTVTVKSNVSAKKLFVKGALIVKNDAASQGMLTFVTAPFPGPYSAEISAQGLLQILNSTSVYHDAIINWDASARVFGRVTIGDGTSTIANGNEAIATQQSSRFTFMEGSVFEWNSITPFATNGQAFFEGFGGRPYFRLTKISPTALGGNEPTFINGVLEVNTPTTWTGSGIKTFSHGVIGTASLTQSPGSGKFVTTASFEDLPGGLNSNAAQYGVVGGNISLQIPSGYDFEQGFTVPTGSSVTLKGSALSLGLTAVQQEASLAIDNASLLTLENADVTNEGNIGGAGILKFSGAIPSVLTSSGALTTEMLLYKKELSLGSTATTAAITLTDTSHITLGVYDLNTGTAALVADSNNFIITNDTGRLSRLAANTIQDFPVGCNLNSYTPVNLINSGFPQLIEVGVSEGIDLNGGLSEGNVNRTWFVGDSSQTGVNLNIKLNWNAAEEQPLFDRSRCYISQYVLCRAEGNCDPYFDTAPAGNCNGTVFFSIERNSIDSFKTNAFIVTSKQSVYTFTGTGDWNNPSNWTPALVAPVDVPAGTEIYINGVGEAVLTGDLLLNEGSKLRIQPGKQLRITGSMIIE